MLDPDTIGRVRREPMEVQKERQAEMEEANAARVEKERQKNENKVIGGLPPGFACVCCVPVACMRGVLHVQSYKPTVCMPGFSVHYRITRTLNVR